MGSNNYWGPQSGIDYPGNDIDSIGTSDRNRCATSCDNTPGCKGFVTATDGQACWLKSDFQNPTPSNTRLANIRNGTGSLPGLPPPPPATWATVKTINSGGAWGGADIPGGASGNSSPSDCQNKCAARSDCQTVAFTSQGGGMCYLKGTLNGSNWSKEYAGQDWTFMAKPGSTLPPIPMAQPPAPTVMSTVNQILGLTPAPSAPMTMALAPPPVPMAMAAAAAVPVMVPQTPANVEKYLRDLRQCIKGTPDSAAPAPAPAMGTSTYTIEAYEEDDEYSFAPAPEPEMVVTMTAHEPVPVPAPAPAPEPLMDLISTMGTSNYGQSSGSSGLVFKILFIILLILFVLYVTKTK